MEILLAKLKVNKARMKSILVKAAASNISDLAKPCFKPSLKKHFYEFLKLSSLTEKDVKDHAKRKWKGRKESTFLIVKDHISNFYVFLMYYFLNKNDRIMFQYFMIFYELRHYAGLFERHFKYCQEDVFKYTLETLTKTHLFAREKTIGNAIYFLSNELIKRWEKKIKNHNDLKEISLFMQESRHRMAQSVRSFANTYYKVAEEGLGIKTEPEPSDDDENAFQQVSKDRSTKLADEITRKIAIYKFVDRIAQEEARKITKINSSLATLIVNSLGDIKYTDQIRSIYLLFIKELTEMKMLCGKDFVKFVRKLMSVKRTKTEIYFKQQVNVLLINVLTEVKYINRYNKVTSQTQFLINLFLAYYLTMIMKRTVCPK